MDKPLQLNEMRVMKEANYKKFRELLSDTSQWGDDILRVLRDNYKELSISRKMFDAVYDSFWDLYCKHSKVPDLTPKKLDAFIQKVKLIVPP